MKSRPIRQVYEAGRSLYMVPLGRKGALEVAVWEEDYKLLRSLGLTGNWAKLQNMHVSAKASRQHVLVARVLLDAKPGQAVRYLDGNPLNLRRENLRLIAHAGTKRRDRDYLTVAA